MLESHKSYTIVMETIHGDIKITARDKETAEYVVKLHILQEMHLHILSMSQMNWSIGYDTDKKACLALAAELQYDQETHNIHPLDLDEIVRRLTDECEWRSQGPNGDFSFEIRRFDNTK